MVKERYGQENIIKVVDVVVEVGNVIPKVVGASSLVGRIGAIGALMDEIIALASLKVSELPKEYRDWSDAEKEAIKIHVNEKFDIPNDQLEALIEAAFDLGLRQIKLGSDIVALATKFRKKVPETAPEAPRTGTKG